MRVFDAMCLGVADLLHICAGELYICAMTSESGSESSLFPEIVQWIGGSREPEGEQAEISNEAAAIGFKMLFWANLAGAGAIMWLGSDDESVRHAAIPIAIAVVVGVIVRLFARSQGADLRFDRQDLFSSRGVLMGLCIGTLVAGYVRARSFDSMAWLEAGGLVAAFVVATWLAAPANAGSAQRSP